MSAQVQQTRFSSGLSALWNVIVAPSAAFAALRDRPTWVTALVVTVVVCTLAQLAMLPQALHAFSVWYPSQLAQDPRTATMTADQRQQALAIALVFARIGPIFAGISAVVAALGSALVLLFAAAIGRGTVSFARMFALAMNVAIIWFGLGQIILAVIVTLRGPNAFSAPWELNLALPSLAWLAPSAPPKLLGFLMGINPFSIWSLLLLGAGTTAIARVNRPIAYGAATLLTLCTCLFLALAIK